MSTFPTVYRRQYFKQKDTLCIFIINLICYVYIRKMKRTIELPIAFDKRANAHFEHNLRKFKKVICWSILKISYGNIASNHARTLGDRFHRNAVAVTISALYITWITRHGAPKASHVTLGRAEKKGGDNGNKRQRGGGEWKGRTTYGVRGGSDVPLTVSNDALFKNF